MITIILLPSILHTIAHTSKINAFVWFYKSLSTLMVNEHEPLNYPLKILSAFWMDAGLIYIYIYYHTYMYIYITYVNVNMYIYIYMYNYTYHVPCASVTVATDKLSN